MWNSWRRCCSPCADGMVDQRTRPWGGLHAGLVKLAASTAPRPAATKELGYTTRKQNTTRPGMRTTVYRTLVMGLNIRLIGLITNNRDRAELIWFSPKVKERTRC
jgi:hypothetical protein